MSTPFDQVMADPDALRALGRGVRRWMTYAFVAGLVLGAVAGLWVLPWLFG